MADLVHRLHPAKYGADEFNPGLQGNARFSPIMDVTGVSIPTIYGGTTFECATMETVFHDVPFAPGLKTVEKRKLRGHEHSQLLPTEKLTLADLSATALRNIGVTRAQLIDTEKDQYPYTRTWAEAIHAQCRDVQGLCWISRQDDRARAIVLFGDRVTLKPFSIHVPPLDILKDMTTYARLIDLADRIGVKIHGR
ncbi:MAG TPA: RES family NAD+ phosphorylase [Sphingobium sp.]|uniref:RES family NAD+ phosphorylase n=1 Tax=Sphingobium sp. TaxID=1912891 RepID=UPI002ED28333